MGKFFIIKKYGVTAILQAVVEELAEASWTRKVPSSIQPQNAEFPKFYVCHFILNYYKYCIIIHSLLKNWPTSANRCGPTDDWDRLRSERTRDTFAESLTATGRSATPAELAELAAARVGDRPPHLAAQEVCTLVAEAMQYATGSTGVLTLASEAWAARRGVCQDFAHLAVGALRSVGIPGPVRVGLLRPASSRPRSARRCWGRATPGSSGGAAAGTGRDPTNNHPACSRHLVVGRGRWTTATRPGSRASSPARGGATWTSSVTITALSRCCNAGGFSAVSGSAV